MRAAPLTPGGAVAWLRSLSVDLRAVAVLDAAGALLAGDARLVARAAQAPDAELVDGERIVVASARHTVAAVVGPRALRRLARADLDAALKALEGA
jgi:hypothetical protein